MHLNQISKLELTDRFDQIISIREIDTLRDELFAYVKGCPFWTISRSDLTLYRAQRFPNVKYCSNTSRLSYPPADCVKFLGRANREHSPILYVAQDGRTAIFESRFKPCEYFAIAEFKLRDEQHLNLQHVGLFGAASKALRDLAMNIPKGFDSQLGLNATGVESVKVIHQLMGNEFMRDVPLGYESEYACSVVIAEFLLTYPEADGLIYPSKRSPNDFNIAIKPASADKKLYIDQVHGFQAIELMQNEVLFQHWAASKDIDAFGHIEWISGDTLPAPSWAGVGFATIPNS
jgi:hypothetical protein